MPISTQSHMVFEQARGAQNGISHDSASVTPLTAPRELIPSDSITRGLSWTPHTTTRASQSASWGSEPPSLYNTSENALVAESEKHEEKISWIEATFIMVAETISLGILSLPYAASRLGLIPFIFLTVGMGVLTTFTGTLVHTLKMRHWHIKSFPEAAEMICGSFARWVVEVMQALFLIFLMAGHLLIFSQEISSFNPQWNCGVAFGLFGMVICIAGTLPRALKSNRWLSIGSCLSILCATIVAMVGIGTQSGDQVYRSLFPIFEGGIYPLAEMMLAMSNIIVSYTGHIAYFNIIDEMKVPQTFSRALATTNAITVTMYTVTGSVIYWFVGEAVQSPALNSANGVVRRIAYGIATPTIIVAGVIAAIVACKRVFQVYWARFKHQPEVTEEQSFRAWSSWIIIVVALWVIAFVIANVIPFFSALLALIGALVGTWICLGFPAIFWIYSNWDAVKSGTKWIMMAFMCFIILLCTTAFVLGLFGSITSVASSRTNFAPFSCHNNAEAHI